MFLDDSEWILLCNGVYRPAEDTWLLLENINRDRVSGKTVVDVCCGSGVIGLYMLKHMNVSRMIFIDIDSRAAYNTMANVRLHKLGYKSLVIQSDLLKPIRSESIDVVVSNPPYLPGSRFIDTDSGYGGGDTVLRVIDSAGEVLGSGGFLYMVFSSLSRWIRVVGHLRRRGFRINRAVARHYFFENLIVVEAVYVS